MSFNLCVWQRNLAFNESDYTIKLFATSYIPHLDGNQARISHAFSPGCKCNYIYIATLIHSAITVHKLEVFLRFINTMNMYTMV